MASLALYLFFGAIVGIFAGLLGVGGGTILVPVLDFTLSLQNVDTNVAHHMALATSMASIIFTSLSSAHSHNKRGTIRWDLVKIMTPGVLAGTFLGSFVVSEVPTKPLKIIFAVFLLYVAMQMFLDFKPKASRQLPGKVTLLAFAVLVGVVSSFIGIGGGSLIIPFLTMCNVPMINVIGVSAAMGFPIAVAGSVGFVVNGLSVPNLPEYSLGFIYLPALAGLVVASMLTAPIGVKLSHTLPVKTLKRVFGCVLAAIALRMAWGIL